MFLRKKWEKFKNNFELQKIVISMNWQFLNTAVQMVAAFFVGVWVIRYLGPERYGFLSYATAVVAFFSIFAKLGLEAITVREMVVGKIAQEKLFGTVFCMKLLGGFLAIGGAVITVFVLKGDLLITYITAVIAFSLIFQATDVIDYWFQSQVQSKYVVYTKSGACIMSASIKFWLIAISASLFWFACVVLVEAVFVAVGLIIAYYKNQKGISRWTYDHDVAIELLKTSWPLILSAFSVIIYMKIDQVMIGDMLGYEALGQYTVAVNLSEMWYFIPMIITASVFPAIIHTKKRSEKLYYARLQKLYDILVWLAISIAILITFLSDWIVSALYGSDYAQAGSVLIIYIWAGIFVSLGVASSNYWITENLTKIAMHLTFFGACLNVILNIFFIPMIGINGAAYATFLSYGISSVLIVAFYKRTRIIFKMQLKTVNIFRIIKYLKQ